MKNKGDWLDNDAIENFRNSPAWPRVHLENPSPRISHKRSGSAAVIKKDTNAVQDFTDDLDQQFKLNNKISRKHKRMKMNIERQRISKMEKKDSIDCPTVVAKNSLERAQKKSTIMTADQQVLNSQDTYGVKHGDSNEVRFLGVQKYGTNEVKTSNLGPFVQSSPALHCSTMKPAPFQTGDGKFTPKC